MNRAIAHSSFSGPGRWGRLFCGTIALLFFSLEPGIAALNTDHLHTEHHVREHLAPILCTTLNAQQDLVGVVSHILIRFEEQHDRGGLRVRFQGEPGRFSWQTRRAMVQAMVRAARAARLRDDSWTVTFTFQQPGVTLYGDSLSAMVGLAVVALAKGDRLFSDRALTGTITQEGGIGIVGGVPRKIEAAHARHLSRVMVPEVQAPGDGDWRTPFLMQISPVGTIGKAYHALTGRPL